MTTFEITLRHMESYLSAHGWRQKTGGPTSQIWNKPTANSMEVLVPAIRDAPDYAKRFAILLDDLQSQEQRPGPQIAEDIGRQFHDVTNHSADHDRSDCIPLDAAQGLFTMARNLTVASAASTISRRGYFGKAVPKKARKQAARVLVGHTRPGSYVVPVINEARLPDFESDTDEPRLIEAVEEAAFERRALTTLARSLEALEMISNGGERQLAPSFLHDAVGEGLSYEMCRSVIRAMEPKSVEGVTVAIMWAPAVRRPDRVSDHFTFSKTCEPQLQAAADFLRHDPIERQEVIYGLVIELHSGSRDEGGRVLVETVIDGSRRHVRIDLNEADYETARESHTRTHVVARGTLHRNPGRTATMDAVSFDQELSLPFDAPRHWRTDATRQPDGR